MGFIKGKSIKDNALKHQARRVIVHFDIKDFFPSITAKRIIGFSRKVLSFDYKAAVIFSELVTYRNILPQGSPCSPILANMICLRMDRQIKAFIHSSRAIYTRYADDMIFSTNNEAALAVSKLISKDENQVVKASDSFRNLVLNNGFELNDRKTSIRKAPGSLKVTGLVVNKKVNVSRSYLKQMRLELHIMGKYKTGNINHLIGKVSYFRFVRGKDDKLACKYCHILNELGKAYFPDADFYLKKEDAVCKYLGCITTNGGNIGTCFFSKGFIITSFHVIEGISKSLPLSFKISFYNGNKKAEENEVTIINGFYYNEIAFLKPNDTAFIEKRELKIAKEKALISSLVSTSGFVHNTIQDNSNPIILDNVKLLSNRNIYDGNFFVTEKGKINKGMSGGPIFDKNFEVVGVAFGGNQLVAINKDDLTDVDNLFSVINYKDFMETIKSKNRSNDFTLKLKN